MKVYLASWFSSKDERAAQAEELRAAGIVVTSRWLAETVSPHTTMDQVTKEYLEATAVVDVEDIQAADYFVIFTVDPKDGPCHRRGGRHWETGFAYGTGAEIIVCGPKENIFHHLPNVLQFDTWEETKAYLIKRAE